MRRNASGQRSAFSSQLLGQRTGGQAKEGLAKFGGEPAPSRGALWARPGKFFRFNEQFPSPAQRAPRQQAVSSNFARPSQACPTRRADFLRGGACFSLPSQGAGRPGGRPRTGGSALLFFLSLTAFAQTSETVAVIAKPVSHVVDLPGEILPYLEVSLHAKVPGYVERVLVDRGSVVKQGDLLVELSAPEMKARIAEAESKAQAVEAERPQAEAQLAAAQATFERLKKAAETPGAVAGNEVIQAEKQVEAAQALVRAREQAATAARAAIPPLK